MYSSKAKPPNSGRLTGERQQRVLQQAGCGRNLQLRPNLAQPSSCLNRSALRCTAVSSSTGIHGLSSRQQWPQQQQHQHQQAQLLLQQQQRCHSLGSARPSAAPRLPARRFKSRHVASAAMTGIIPLGYDFLTFLATTVAVVPTCKFLKVSPVLGFLAAGVALEQAGMLKDLKDMETLSELGVLFLLYEQGLELSLDRLKALSKYAFGMGSLQVILSTLLFTAVALPVGSGLGTWFLEAVCHAPPSLVSIRTVDEAVVIAAALSMSSSAFVLQLLAERGEAPTRVGSATLGILLFQDIAVVPFLVLLPLIESNGGMEGTTPQTLLSMLGPTAATSLLGLGALLVGGRVVLRRIFEIIAESRSSEAFVALCLLTVGGSGLLTKMLGLSDTLGAFIAGVLLAETSFRTQVEADIRPFRGLLIGLFFMSVGGSINMGVLRDNWDVIAWMLAGLVSLKAAVNIALGPLFGLSKSESIRTGFLLSQGGEFAFVLLTLACQLQLLPEELNQILIITVVFSMALTPALAELGSRLGAAVEAAEGGNTSDDEAPPPILEVEDPVVILGFGPQGQMLANMLASPLAQSNNKPRAYIGFDLDHARVTASRRAGFNVAYGNGGRPGVLKAAGVKKPSAIVVCHSGEEAALKAVEGLRSEYRGVPIYACAQNFKHAAELRAAGADKLCIVNSEAGLNLGAQLLADLGSSETSVSLLRRGINEALAVRTAADNSTRNTAAAAEEAPAPADAAAKNGAAAAAEKKKKKQKQVELFVLDGKHAYGLRAEALARAVTPDLPCTECPLVRQQQELDILSSLDESLMPTGMLSSSSSSAVSVVDVDAAAVPAAGLNGSSSSKGAAAAAVNASVGSSTPGGPGSV
uniref:RCK N-terminal domain-containing protein n=1 Tax=Tetradesmus obliquus TaxID=3088 RepID=A0A383V6H6_TETOB|eukprot:jgi/Sobl393_1/12180/SZX60392.1